jgi:hypothetical protein
VNPDKHHFLAPVVRVAQVSGEVAVVAARNATPVFIQAWILQGKLVGALRRQ